MKRTSLLVLELSWCGWRCPKVVCSEEFVHTIHLFFIRAQLGIPSSEEMVTCLTLFYLATRKFLQARFRQILSPSVAKGVFGRRTDCSRPLLVRSYFKIHCENIE